MKFWAYSLIAVCLLLSRFLGIPKLLDHLDEKHRVSHVENSGMQYAENCLRIVCYHTMKNSRRSAGS